MDLSTFNSKQFNRGCPAIVEIIWIFIHGLLFSSFLPGSTWRCILLKIFGAKIGKKIIIKPKARVKFPWKLKVGDYSWIGEDVWIDNLDNVEIGSNCSLSQGTYLCTGNHNWSKPSFDFITKPIIIKDHSWLGAKSIVTLGVTVGEGGVLTLGSIATTNLEPWSVYKGNPATFISKREYKTNVLQNQLPKR